MRCQQQKTGGTSLAWLLFAIPSLLAESRRNKSRRSYTTARGKGLTIMALGSRAYGRGFNMKGKWRAAV